MRKGDEPKKLPKIWKWIKVRFTIRKKCKGLQIKCQKRLKELEEDIQKLSQTDADPNLDNLTEEYTLKKVLRSSDKQIRVSYLIKQYKVLVKKACQLVHLKRSMEIQLKQERVIDIFLELAEQQSTRGFDELLQANTSLRLLTEPKASLKGFRRMKLQPRSKLKSKLSQG